MNITNVAQDLWQRVGNEAPDTEISFNITLSASATKLDIEAVRQQLLVGGAQCTSGAFGMLFCRSKLQIIPEIAQLPQVFYIAENTEAPLKNLLDNAGDSR